MEEKKDRWAWLKRSDHNYLVPFVIVSTTLVALWLVEERNQEKEMARLQREIEEMDREIQNLRNNPDTLETFARETYHFAAPGDDVYIVE